jgi:hypothetical protein
MGVFTKQEASRPLSTLDPRSWMQQLWVQQVVLFFLCLVVLLRTMVPTLYTLDSAELATGVATLGIVHAPGYPLYLLSAHLFTLLPFGDIAFKINLFSVICLALTVAILYGLLNNLLADRWVALAATLVFAWSYRVWSAGLVTEIYAPQLVTLAVCGWILIRIYRLDHPDWNTILGMGASVGIAIATVPSSILFIPGVIVVFLTRRIPFQKSLGATLTSLAIFGLSLLYFPFRYAANPLLNMAGEYAVDGSFQSVNLLTPQGIWWMLSGVQFRKLFFANGFLPGIDAILKTITEFWANFLGFGLIIGLIGLWVLYKTNRNLLFVWLAFFLPYLYFYTTYGAPDRDTMFGPAYLLWTIPLAYGLQWATSVVPTPTKRFALTALPLIMLIINFPLLDASRDTTVRDYAQTLIKGLPTNATVFGVWWDIAPLQYLQIVEKQRPDLKLINIFLFDKKKLADYVDMRVNDPDQYPDATIFLSDALSNLDLTRYSLFPLDINNSLPVRSGGVGIQGVSGGFYVAKQQQ